jgi:hypothetical protein
MEERMSKGKSKKVSKKKKQTPSRKKRLAKVSSEPKKIMYLIGSGATHAEADHKGGTPENMLLADLGSLGGIARAVLEETNADRVLSINESRRGDVDIEKLITLLEGTGVDKYRKLAENLRENYFNEIIKRAARKSLFTSPELAITLLEMHKDEKFSNVEQLTAIINLNHDNLFHVASEKVYGGVNLGFYFESEHFNHTNSKKVPLLLHLHGSFSWENGNPIRIVKLDKHSKYEKERIWIPPSTYKEAKDYPFSKLAGLVHEALVGNCDILRVVGCSLSQNDWNLITLIYNAQMSKSEYSDDKISIELIMNPSACKNVQRQTAYFEGMKRTDEMILLKEKLYEGYDVRSAGPHEEGNPFKYWLKRKILDHALKRHFTNTNKKMFIERLN